MIFILKLGRQKKGVDGTLDGTTEATTHSFQTKP